MIFSKEDLRDYIAMDNARGTIADIKQRAVSIIAAYPQRQIKLFLRCLRKQEYYINTANGSKIKGILGILWERKKNRIGNRLGFEIGPNCFGMGLTIYHAGTIVINPAARIGTNCKLHGSNCIGNNGKDEGVPRIGNYVDIGFGAVIIGDIEIADGVTVGANAVVNRSITTPGSVVVGVPAKIVRVKSDY